MVLVGGRSCVYSSVSLARKRPRPFSLSHAEFSRALAERSASYVLFITTYLPARRDSKWSPEVGAAIRGQQAEERPVSDAGCSRKPPAQVVVSGPDGSPGRYAGAAETNEDAH